VPCKVKKDDIEPNKERLYVQDSFETLERMHIDLCGQLHESDGNKWIVVLEDAYSKWLEAKPLKDSRAASVIKWLEEEVFNRFGAPDLITSDQGSQFESAEFKEFCGRFGVKQHFTTPHHHMGNGLAERAIQTIEKMTRTTIVNQDNWSEALPQLIYAYNTRKHCTTGVTPYSLMFNREARNNLDREFDLERVVIDAESNNLIARRNRDKQMDRMKEYYDRRANQATFQPGELVVWHVHEQGLGKSRKLNQRWQGPFRVDEIKRPNLVLSDCNGKTKLIHMNHVKRTDNQRTLGEFRGRGRPRIRGRCGSGAPLPTTPAPTDEPTNT